MCPTTLLMTVAPVSPIPIPDQQDNTRAIIFFLVYCKKAANFQVSHWVAMEGSALLVQNPC